MSKLLLSGLVLLLSPLFCTETPSYTLIEDKNSYPLLNPDMQDRKTAKIRLNNGLTAYLISDPHAEQSGACLCVGAGSWNDPKEFPGTAHFLEHMLFLGTEKYPDEAEYKSFILDHGGIFNAFTAPDFTSYLFSINNDHFLDALDRFSQFFIAPLFNESCLERELQAVDQEHAKNIESDHRREYMIFKECGNPHHPNHAFSTGNAQTLSLIPQKTLKEWYRNHYSADRMRVLLLSSLPLETLIEAASKQFSSVKSSDYAPEHITEHLTTSLQKGKITYIKPIKEIRSLSMVWELPSSLVNSLGESSAKLIAYILKNEGEGSLSKILKSKKIAESIEVQASHFGSENLLFQIEVHLTEQGINQIPEAIAICFETLSALKEQTIPLDFATELQNLKKIHYQYQSRENVFSHLMSHATIFLQEPIESYPEKSLVSVEYDPDTLKKVLSCLTPDECIFTVVADPELLNIKMDKKEKWVGAEYTIAPIEEKKLLAWKNSPQLEHYRLPQKNSFIPSQLALVNSSESLDVSLIKETPAEKVYFAKDDHYRLPEVSHFIHLKSPFFTNTIKTELLTDLYLMALKEKLSSSLYHAGNAGLNAEFAYKEFELCINVHGYSEKASDFVMEIVNNLSSVRPSKEEFAIFKQTKRTTLANFSKEPPLTQALEVLSTTLYNNAFASEEKLHVLDHLTYEEFIHFSERFLNDLSINALFYGNLRKQDALSLYKSIQKTLNIQDDICPGFEAKRVLALYKNEGPYQIEKATSMQGNAIVLLIQEDQFSFKNRALQQILAQVIKTHFFETLRTKQQVAYLLHSWEKEDEGQLFQCFALQSNSHQPQEILARIDLFLESLNYQFAHFCSESNFETIRETLITKLRKPPENLQSKGLLLDKLAFTYGGDFQWIEKRIQALEELSYAELKETCKEFFSRNNQRRIAVLIEGILPREKNFRYKTTSKEELREKGSFVSWIN